MVTRLAAALFVLATLAVPTLASAKVDVATTGATCPSPTKIGISADPGATCVTGVGTNTLTWWVWTGAAWSLDKVLTNPIGATTSAVDLVAGCVASVIPGIATGQSPLPTCNGGDTVSSVQRRDGLLTPPGAGFITERWRPSRFYGLGFCEKVAIGGQRLTEVVIAGGAGSPRIPC